MFENDDEIKFITAFNYSNNKYLNSTNFKKKNFSKFKISKRPF